MCMYVCVKHVRPNIHRRNKMDEMRRVWNPGCLTNAHRNDMNPSPSYYKIVGHRVLFDLGMVISLMGGKPRNSKSEESYSEKLWHCNGPTNVEEEKLSVHINCTLLMSSWCYKSINTRACVCARTHTHTHICIMQWDVHIFGRHHIQVLSNTVSVM